MDFDNLDIIINKKKCKRNNKYIPKGGIIMWSGTITSIPNGWLLCDGTYNTPNLQDKFIMGSGKNNIGSIGGNSEIILQTNNLPPHTHTYNTTETIGMPRLMGTAEPERVNMLEQVVITKITDNGPGESAPIDITPTFYTLAFIMKK